MTRPPRRGRWVHYGSAPLGALRVVPQEPQGDYVSAHTKPRGLWVSDADDHGWKDWCEGEDFMCHHFTVAQEITFHDDAKLLRITNADELLAFTKAYGQPDSFSVRHAGSAFYSGMGQSYAIDWVRVAAEYDGILITPYLWSMRMNHTVSWYYGWDCASGCIWNPRAIAHVGEPQPVVFNGRSYDDEESEDEPVSEVQPPETEATD